MNQPPLHRPSSSLNVYHFSKKRGRSKKLPTIIPGSFSFFCAVKLIRRKRQNGIHIISAPISGLHFQISDVVLSLRRVYLGSLEARICLQAYDFSSLTFKLPLSKAYSFLLLSPFSILPFFSL